MTSQVTNHKCPACTGPLHYVGASDKLECDFCGNKYDVAEIEAMYASAEDKAEAAFAEDESKNSEAHTEWDTSEFEQWGTDEKMKAYGCPSCGAELICDETTAATSCPYCGNPAVIPGQFSGGLKPNYIIPFKLDKNAAKAALQKHYKGKKFLPDTFAAGNRIEEIKGVYVPFWLFDGVTEVDAVFDATDTHCYDDGDYEVTETKHFDVRRAGVVPFEKIPVDGSSKMPDNHMDAIEPFDYSEMIGFSTAYLPGFLADKYDISSEDSAGRADERAVNTAIDAMRADISGYDSCTLRGHSVNLHRSKVHYGLLPVYMLATKWNNQSYLFAMNGQTGKLIGDLPIDKVKYRKWFWGITAGVTVVLGTILSLLI